ncbi:MAG: FKBP-type peptidyl-prolyl cis-trans isomerase [Puniceicoccales bacterium]|jgi:FKBP-type peptidyl-prolyl cis-trans isomerase|nr:FKBP-type peptidyl-prolyl cis-trans isomerase [Puniceicoccales bacterium]
MNRTLFALALVALASTAASVSAAESPAAPAPKQPVAAPAAPAPAPLTAEQKEKVLEILGWHAAQGALPGPLEYFGFNAAEVEIILRGFRDGAQGKELPKDARDIFPKLNQFLQEKYKANQPVIQAKLQKQQAEWLAKNQDFLRNIDKDQSVKSTPSGLRYKILAEGTGPRPLPTSKVKALYEGKLVDGTVFDSTKTRNNEPTEFALNAVIPGWTEGLQKISKGGKIILYVPHTLGYGEQGSGQVIPPLSTLTFEVELVDISNEAPPASGAPKAPGTK